MMAMRQQAAILLLAFVVTLFSLFVYSVREGFVHDAAQYDYACDQFPDEPWQECP